LFLDSRDPNRYNGLRVKSPDQPNVYLIDKGTRRWIVSAAVHGALFRGWEGILTVLNIEEIVEGPPIVEGGTQLMKAVGVPNVYWYDKEDGVKWVKRFIPSPEVFNKYYFNWNNIQEYNQGVINGLSPGNTLR
jgi:hypothetical protein